MSESSGPERSASKRNQGTLVPNCSPDSRNSFAIAAKALWPRKTAAELALRAKVSERLAKYWLSGERDPSFDVCMVIIEEIRPRRRL